MFSLLKALAHEIDLGDMAVYTSNVGIQVLYRCEYETALTVSSESFDVQARVKHYIIHVRLKNIYLLKMS